GVAIYANDRKDRWPAYSNGHWSTSIIRLQNDPSFAGLGLAYDMIRNKQLFMCPEEVPNITGYLTYDWDQVVTAQHVFSTYTLRGNQQYLSNPPGPLHATISGDAGRALFSCFILHNNGDRPRHKDLYP